MRGFCSRRQELRSFSIDRFIEAHPVILHNEAYADEPAGALGAACSRSQRGGHRTCPASNREGIPMTQAAMLRSAFLASTLRMTEQEISRVLRESSQAQGRSETAVPIVERSVRIALAAPI